MTAPSLPLTYGSALGPVHAWIVTGDGLYRALCDARLCAKVLHGAHKERREGVKYCQGCLAKLEGK